MVERKQIKRFVKEVAEEFAPQRIVLFGSYAKGGATEDSDVDLMVIMTHKKRNVDQALEIDQKIHRSFPLDLIVKTPAEIKSRLAQKDVFISSVVNEGKVLYENNC